ncbi:M57 family metalloprotease [Apilactobacillus timberlakei]|uniref:M57 family metalloprotease n=1 Tax=Apilactobacillus timberlakei TaxID=2008380 RepID=UPI001126BEDA|nr:M57 family metalloprotease [Apilactobacillus timberlakei]TPR16761.1 hypothetical protein DYZ95_07205 [Apilactobacillus timberlakei]TPR21524.1 hypothetical protein DY083_05755 [Apilactobacillus timberlakei]
MKKTLFLVLGLSLFASPIIINSNKTLASTNHLKSNKGNHKLYGINKLGKKRFIGKDETFNYYEKVKKDGTKDFIVEVNAKYPQKHTLPFIKDYRTGLFIKQKPYIDGTIRIKYKGSQRFIHNFEKAVHKWNSLGLIKLRIVNSDEDSEINILGNSSLSEDMKSSSYQKNSLGNTDNYVDYNSDTYLKDGTHMKYISQTNIRLYSILLKQSENNIDHVITHEIGHSLGFDDLYRDEDRGLIMYASSSVGAKLLNNIDSCERLTIQHFYLNK